MSEPSTMPEFVAHVQRMRARADMNYQTDVAAFGVAAYNDLVPTLCAVVEGYRRGLEAAVESLKLAGDYASAWQLEALLDVVPDAFRKECPDA